MRAGRILVATACCTVAVLALGTGAADATPVPSGASASSLPAYTGSATLSASLSLTGSIGGLLQGLITPIVNQALNPIVAALQGSLNTLVASSLGVSSTYHAGSPSVQAGPAPGAFPTDLPGGLPSPCTTTSTTQPCYNGTGSPSLSLPGLASFSVGALRGYTQQVQASSDASNPIFGRSQIASTSLSVLPGVSSIVSPVLSASTIDAKANCPASTSATALVSTASLQLLGGAVTTSVANGGLGQITVNGQNYTLGNLPTIAVGSTGFTISAYGSAIRLTVPVTPTALVSALGLSGSAVTSLLADALPGTAFTLSVIVGPNTQVTSTSAQAWGLGIGVDLSGNLGFNLLGLVGATITVPSGIGGGNYGNVLDARLAYASCTSAVPTGGSTPFVPPALI